MTVPVSQCVICKHYLGDAKCKAFPDGIPEILLDNGRPHIKPYPGDGGYRFTDAYPDEDTKGGPGSGWFAPPKGTHKPGSQGGVALPTVKREPQTVQYTARGRTGVCWIVKEGDKIPDDVLSGGDWLLAYDSRNQRLYIGPAFAGLGHEGMLERTAPEIEIERRFDQITRGYYFHDRALSDAQLVAYATYAGLGEHLYDDDVVTDGIAMKKWGKLARFLIAGGMSKDTTFSLQSNHSKRKYHEFLGDVAEWKSLEARLKSLRKGGPGSGWWAPPKGTHGPGSQSGHAPTSDLIDFGYSVYASYWLDDGIDAGWEHATDAERSAVKSEVVSKIAERSGIDRETVNAIIGAWADTSFDEDMRCLTLQQDAALEFGLKPSDAVAKRIEQVKAGLASQIDNYIKLIETERFYRDLWRESGSPPKAEFALHLVRTSPLPRERERFFEIADSGTRRKVLRAMYDITQEELRGAEIGTDGYVTLFRGVSAQSGRPYGLGEMEYHGNPLESWTVSRGVAYDFAVSHETRLKAGLLVAMRVPTSSIIGTAKTGFGCLTEGEFVVLNPRGMCYVTYVHEPWNKGGEGSGWWAPPRGTHGEGSQGGDVDNESEYDDPWGKRPPKPKPSPEPKPKPKPPEPKPEPEPPKPKLKKPGEFETPADAAAWVNSRWPGISCEFEGVDMGILNRSLQQFERLAADFPFVPAVMTYFGTATGKRAKLHGIPEPGAHTWAETWGKRGWFVLNKAFFGNPALLEKAMADSQVVRPGSAVAWHPPGCGTPESMITHEFGHLLDSYLRERAYDFAFTDLVSMDGFGNVGTTWNLWREAEQRRLSAGTVSIYAKKNISELMAESFSSMYHTPRERQAPCVRRMQKILQLIGPHNSWRYRGGWDWVTAGEVSRTTTEKWAATRLDLGIPGW